jgi:LysR family hydrogen peroxide-inducible transcriptional activator
MMLLEDGHCLRDQALAVCGFPPLVDSEDFRASSLETLRHMVAAGVGSTLLPLLATTSLLLTTPLLALRPFVVPVPYRTIGLVWRQRFPRQETMHTLTAFLRDHKPPGVMAIDDADCPALS